MPPKNMRPFDTRHASFRHLSFPLRGVWIIFLWVVLFLSGDVRAADRILLKDLDVLFELGLPRTAGAEWVASSSSYGAGLPESEPKVRDSRYQATGTVYAGNVWLERTASGEAWMIEAFVKRVPCSPVQRASFVGSKPSVLKTDLQKLKGILRDEGKLPESSEDGTSERGWGEAHRAAALLFLVQAGQAGAAAEAQDALDVLISGADSNTELLENAFGRIAKERYLNALKLFFKGEAAEIVAAQIEGIVNDFGPYWTHRDAAILVAERLRIPTPSPYADQPDAAWAAKLLQSTPAHEFQKFPLNWLFSLEQDAWIDLATHGYRDQDFQGDISPREAEAKKEPSLHQLLQDTDRAILGLADLMDDHRFLRVPFYSYGDESPRRPMEIGDAALQLLRAVIPEETATSLASQPAGRRQIIIEWFTAYQAAGKIQKAIEIIQRSESIRQCSGALQFVLKNGNAEDLRRIRPLFTDVVAWRSESPLVMRLLWDYVDRMRALGAPDEAMEADAVAAMGRLPSDEKPDPLEGERWALRVIFHPDSWTELLGAMAQGTDQRKNDPKRVAMANMLGTAIRRETTAARFQDVVILASKCDSTTRFDLVQQLYLGSTKHPCTGQGWSAEGKEAVLRLMDDDSPFSPDLDGSESIELGSAWTISSVMWRCFWRGEIPEGKLEWLSSEVPDSVKAWQTKSVMAILNGEPQLSFPTAADATVVATQLDALAKKSPDAVYSAFESLSLDVQIGILEALSAKTNWPDSLQRAQLRVGTVVNRAKGDLSESIKAWEGQMLDAALWKKMEDEVQSLAAKGEKWSVNVECATHLRGLSISIQESESEGIPLVLPGGWTMPKLAFVRQFLQISEEKGSTHVELLWASPREAAAWQKYYVAPAQQVDKPASRSWDDDGDPIKDADPAPFQNALKDVFLRKSAKDTFWLSMAAVPVTPPKSEKDSEPSKESDVP